MASIETLTSNFNVTDFLDFYHISYSLSGINVSKNYIGIEVCPFCGKGKTHSGINKDHHGFNCWICGGHSLFNFIKSSLNINNKEVFFILKKFQDESSYYCSSSVSNYEYSKECSFPTGTQTVLSNRFKQYVLKRGYPESVIKKYNIRNTNESGDFCHRLIFPFYLHSRMVTFLSRAISKKDYKDCPISNSIVPPKETVFNFDNLHFKSNCLITEGVFDCMKIGDNCISTSTSECSDNQIRLILSKKPEKVYVCYDTEREAQEHAKKLCSTLSMYTKAERIQLESGDVGDLTPEDGFSLRKMLKLKGNQF